MNVSWSEVGMGMVAGMLSYSLSSWCINGIARRVYSFCYIDPKSVQYDEKNMPTDSNFIKTLSGDVFDAKKYNQVSRARKIALGIFLFIAAGAIGAGSGCLALYLFKTSLVEGTALLGLMEAFTFIMPTPRIDAKTPPERAPAAAPEGLA